MLNWLLLVGLLLIRLLLILLWLLLLLLLLLNLISRRSVVSNWLLLFLLLNLLILFILRTGINLLCNWLKIVVLFYCWLILFYSWWSSTYTETWLLWASLVASCRWKCKLEFRLNCTFIFSSITILQRSIRLHISALISLTCYYLISWCVVYILLLLSIIVICTYYCISICNSGCRWFNNWESWLILTYRWSWHTEALWNTTHIAFILITYIILWVTLCLYLIWVLLLLN